jgi:hypothetical protein
LAFANKDWSQVTTFFDADCAPAQAAVVARLLRERGARGRPKTMVIERIDDEPARTTPLGEALLGLGYRPAARGAVSYSMDPALGPDEGPDP